MIKKRVLRVLQWMHITILLSIIFPMLYGICMEREDKIQYLVYWCALSIFIPVVFTDVAIRKSKQMITYFIVSMVILFGSGAAVWRITHISQFPKAIRDAYFVLTLAEVLFLIFDRFFWRMNLVERKQRREAKDASWRPRKNYANQPTLFGVIVFFCAYVVGKNFASPILCNQALFSGIAYLAIFVIATYIKKTEEYLRIRRNTCHLPRKRIYGISGCMLAAFFGLLVLATVPSVVTISDRTYRDYRTFIIDEDAIYEPFKLDEEDLKKKYIDPVKEAKKRLKKMKKAPWWENLLFYSIGVVILGALVGAAVRIFWGILHNFRAEMDENGDQVEAIKEDEKEKTEKTKSVLRKHKPKNEREKIRLQYKKRIEAHYKERLRGSETPVELEKVAGIAGFSDAQEFHECYEWARYADESERHSEIEQKS